MTFERKDAPLYSYSLADKNKPCAYDLSSLNCNAIQSADDMQFFASSSLSSTIQLSERYSKHTILDFRSFS